MKCRICGSEEIDITYFGKIRNGGVGNYTHEKVKMYKCKKCDVIWHENIIQDIDEYYRSNDYRSSINEDVNDEVFYKAHDFETKHKLEYTGTEIFRNKIVVDIGCGAGAFLDFLYGSAKKVIGVEPTEEYHKVLDAKNIEVYSYAIDMKSEYIDKIDVITSFDVIEHVNDPFSFLKDKFELLNRGGLVIVGTPTEAPVMRRLLGEKYDEFLFSTQHLWVFSEKSLVELATKVGFSKIHVKYFQRYNLSNTLLWLKDGKPNGHCKLDFISETLENTWKSEMEEKKNSDYIVLYCEK